MLDGVNEAAPRRQRLSERNRSRRTAQVRQEILDAAIAEFADRGYHEASLTHIAERVGTGPSTIYTYFSNKRDILGHAVAGALAALMQSLGSVTSDPPQSVDEFELRAQQFGDLMTDVLLEDPRIPRMIVMMCTSTDTVLRDKWAEAYSAYVGAVSEFLAGGIKAGFLRADLDPASTAEVVVAIPFGLITCDAERFAVRVHAEAAVRAAVAIVANGVRRD